MDADNALEDKQCPVCWKGIVYNTGVKQKKSPFHIFYQCSYCGKTMTREKYKLLLEHSKMPKLAPVSKSKSLKKVIKSVDTAVKVTVVKTVKKRLGPHPGFVVGYVRDALTGRPVEMAHICIKGRSIESFANRYGQYTLEPVPEHKPVTLEFTSPGHEKRIHMLKGGIRRDEIRRVDVLLKPTRKIKVPASLPKPPFISIMGGKVKEVSRSGIEGLVRDTNGNPVFGALVTIFHYERILVVQTDTMGHYELMNVLPPGDYMARAVAYGYSFERRWIRIEKGRAVRCDFTLTERKKTRS